MAGITDLGTKEDRTGWGRVPQRLGIFHDARLEALCREAPALQQPLSPPGALVCAVDYGGVSEAHNRLQGPSFQASCMSVVGGVQDEEPSASTQVQCRGEDGVGQQRPLTFLQRGRPEIQERVLSCRSDSLGPMHIGAYR